MTIWDRDTVPEFALKLTPKFEADILHPYRDSSGVWTEGVGSTFMPDGKRVTGGSPNMTMAESIALLGTQEKKWVTVVARAITVPLDEVWASVLIDFTHNEGPGAIWNSMIAKMLNAGRPDLAVRQLPGWIIGGGVKVLGLARRRCAEAGVIANGGDLDAAYDAAWRMSLTQLMPAYNQAFVDAQDWNRSGAAMSAKPVSAPASTPAPAPIAPNSTDDLNLESLQGTLSV